MLEKGFLRNQTDGNFKHYRIASIASNTLLFLGAILLVGSFIYLLFNLDKSDSLIVIEMPIIISGIGLIIVSQLIKRSRPKLHR